MEKRAILAAVLMAAVFIVYQMFFFPETPPPAKPAANSDREPAAYRPRLHRYLRRRRRAHRPRRERSQAARPPQRLVTVESPLYRDVVSSEGGKLQELVLRYRGEKPMVIVGDLGPGGLHLAPDENGPGEVVPMSSRQGFAGPDGQARRARADGRSPGSQGSPDADVPAGWVCHRRARASRESRRRAADGHAHPALADPADWRGTAEKFQGQHPTEIVWSTHGSVESNR